MSYKYREQYDFDIRVSDESSSDEEIKREGSTRSLLTPLYASDYESNIQQDSRESINVEIGSPIEKQFKGPQRCSTPKDWKGTKKEIAENQVNHRRTAEFYDLQNNQKRMSWEDWVVKKTLEALEITEERRQEQRQKKEDKRKKEKEKIDKLKEAEIKRSEWLEKKLFETRKKLKEECAQKKYRNIKERQMKELTESRSKEKYSEWCKKKTEEEQERKRKMKEIEERRMKAMQERKAKNDLSYSKWLEEARRKSRTPQKSGNKNIKLDMFGTVSPDYVNPIPWTSPVSDLIVEAQVGYAETMYKSPPLLWKDYEHRERGKKRNSEQKKRCNQIRRPVRHSCI